MKRLQDAVWSGISTDGSQGCISCVDGPMARGLRLPCCHWAHGLGFGTSAATAIGSTIRTLVNSTGRTRFSLSSTTGYVQLTATDRGKELSQHAEPALDTRCRSASATTPEQPARMLQTFDRAAKAMRVKLVDSAVAGPAPGGRYRSRAQPLRPPSSPWEDFDFLPFAFLPFALAFFGDVPEPPP